MSERAAVILTYVVFSVLGFAFLATLKLLGAGDQLLAFAILPLIAGGSYALSAVTHHYCSKRPPGQGPPSVFGDRRYPQRRP
jgi:hypothetical protein